MAGKLILLSALLLLLPHEARATIRTEALGSVEVRVEGARRTRPRYVESLVKECLKKEGYKTWDAVDAAALSQCISNTKLFRKVEVKINRPEIDVTITDRWTLIPLPNFYATDGKRSAGLFVFDSNFLGRGKTAGVGAGTSTEGNTFSLMYADPSVGFSDYTFTVMAFRSYTEIDAYAGSDAVDGYEKKETGFFLSPGYRLTPSWEASVSFGYGNRRYAQIDAFAVPGDYQATTAGARLSYKNADYKLFYNDGLSASLMWFGQVHRSDGRDNFLQTKASLEWDVALFRKQALQLGLRAGLQTDNGNRGDVATYGREKGYRGIEPDGLWTRRIAAASVDEQIPVARTGHGTFTVAPFVDYGTYTPFSPGNDGNYTAYGIGAYYFINFINLPGVGLVVGRNREFMGNFVSFQIGGTFY